MLDDGLEEDEELPDDQVETVEGAEAMGDDDTTDFAGAAGTFFTEILCRVNCNFFLGVPRTPFT